MSDAGKTLQALAMLGGAGMTTNTPDTTRLTDEQVQESLSWLSRAQQAERHTVAVALWANTYGHQLHAHITTLAAELARVEGGNARLRDVITNVPTLIAEVRRLRAAQITTLVACSRCGHGHRARHMVALGDERLCVTCAGVELGRLRGAVTASEEYFIAVARSEANFDQAEAETAFRRYNAALHALHAAAAPGAGEGE